MSGLTKAADSDRVAALNSWLVSQEGEQLEFKEARNAFSEDELAKYCCALANEGGGKLVLGVSDRRPRRVVGTTVFSQVEAVRRKLMEQLPLRIEIEEILHPDGRALAFHIPSRPLGNPLRSKGVYWSRQADSLVPMAEDRLRTIFSETGKDFSSEICAGAQITDLDEQAINEFRRRWIQKANNSRLEDLATDQLLKDAELLLPEGITYAALILFGQPHVLSKFLPQAEVIFEHRSSEAAGPAAQRIEYRKGFFSFHEDLWGQISLRNDVQHYQEGLFVFDVPTLAERSVREAVLNAVCHRDYQLGGSVFVRQYSRRLVIESPGGLPVGINPENILDRQAPRNRRIAEALARCGLVERSGQGMNLMFEESIRQGKLRPEFTGTDAYQVVLTLHGQVRDPRFVRFFEDVNRQLQVSFDVHDFLLIDLIHREEPVPDPLRARLRRLIDLGVVETIGRGKGTRYLLARRFHSSASQAGVYTRRKGLDREQNKAILLKHIRSRSPRGCAMAELQQVLPALNRQMIKGLLRELKAERAIRLEGSRRGARWLAGRSEPDLGGERG